MFDSISRNLRVLGLGCLFFIGTLIFIGFSGDVGAAEPAESYGPQAEGRADIVWTRVHSGTLGGTTYDDLYWGGNANQRLDLVDIDSDGDLDLFIAGENRQNDQRQELHFYRNDGTTSAPDWTHVTNQYFDTLGWASNRPSFVDLNSDGDYDCVLDGGTADDEYGFFYYENTGNASTPAWTLRSQDMTGDGSVGSQTFADIDGDGDQDLFYGHAVEVPSGSIATIGFCENTGTAVSPAWTCETPSYNNITSTTLLHPSFTDIDADNDLDLFLGTSGRIIFYRNDGDVNTPSWTHVTDTYGNIQYGWGATHFQLAFGDLNGDNTQDMIIGHEIGWLTSYQNTGTVNNAAWTLREEAMFPMNYGVVSNPALADIDADGDEDLFLGMGTGWDSAKLAFLRNDGTAALPDWTYVTGEYGGMTPEGERYPTFVDINGDGDLDCFIGTGPFFGTPGGTISYYENTGTAISPTWMLISDTYMMINEPDQRVIPAFADIDGDGDQDFFASIEGQHRFYRNDGNATTPNWTLVTQSYGGFGGNALAFSDVDNDGDLDLFTDMAFYRNDGDATEASWSAALAPQGLEWSGGPPALADILGNDGRPELLLGGRGGVFVYENLGDLPPQVTAVAPSDSGNSLPLSAIVATFDNTMDVDTMTAANISVVGSASGVVAGTLSYEASSKQLVFLVEDKFSEGETVNVTLKAAITDDTGHGLDGDSDGVAEGSPTDDVSWSFTVQERDHLVVSMIEEPASLYFYDNQTMANIGVFGALYDGPIERRSYSHQPIILAKLPSIADGDAVINQVTVQTGDQVVDTYNNVVTLANGMEIRPTGCRSTNCAVTFDGTPVQMDQLAVTFELLPDIRWSDGVTVTADDSLYSYELNLTEPNHYSDFPPTPDQLARTASYEALDTLRTRWTALPGYLDSRYNQVFWHPLPRHAWEGQGLTPNDLHTAPESTQTPLGWGPYAVESWEAGVAITMTANPYYYRAAEGLPKIDTLVIHFNNNGDDALAEVLAGQTDATWGIWGDLPDSLLSFEGDGAVNAHVKTGTAWEHGDFAIDTRDTYPARPDYFEDREMRQAIAYCLDRQAMVDAVTGGYGQVLNTYIPAEHPLYPGDENLTLYPHNVVSGTQLLANLGWTDTNGDGIRECNSCTTAGAVEDDPLTFSWLTMDVPLRSTYAQMAQADLAECGIDLVVDARPIDDLWWRIFSREYDMASFAWISDFEPGCNVYVSDQIPSDANGWNGLNNPAFSNAAYDAACTAALTSLPGTVENVNNHHEAMRILSEEAPIVPLFSRLEIAATHPRLIGLRLDPTSRVVLNNVETWEFLADELPPEGTLEAGDGSQAQNTTPITLYLDASDRGGGTVEQMLIRERTWDGNDWVVVAETGWIPYAATYGWDLDPTPAAHYLSAYFMDDTGNTTSLPAQTLVNLTPASGDILEDEIVVYRARMASGDAFTATLTTLSGDADLYVWAPGNEGEPDVYSNLDGDAADEVVITDTLAGDYHIEVRGYAAASTYQLSLNAPDLSPAMYRAAAGPAAEPMAKAVPSEPLTVEVPDATPATAPGGLPATADLRAPRLTLDVGADSVQLTGEVWDQKGTHVPEGTVVTFTTTLGAFASNDAQVVTATTTAGLARATLVSGMDDGTAQVSVEAGAVDAELAVNVRWPFKLYLPLTLRSAP